MLRLCLVQTATLRSRIVGEWFQNSHFWTWFGSYLSQFSNDNFWWLPSSFTCNILDNSPALRMKWVVVLNFHVGREFSEAVEGDFELITVTKYHLKCKSYTHLPRKWVQINLIRYIFKIWNLYHVILNFRCIFAKKKWSRLRFLHGSGSLFLASPQQTPTPNASVGTGNVLNGKRKPSTF